jgi:hypothetical protein
VGELQEAWLTWQVCAKALLQGGSKSMLRHLSTALILRHLSPPKSMLRHLSTALILRHLSPPKSMLRHLSTALILRHLSTALILLHMCPQKIKKVCAKDLARGGSNCRLKAGTPYCSNCYAQKYLDKCGDPLCAKPVHDYRLEFMH